jgi:uncharacterized alpha-E superfamily protein
MMLSTVAERMYWAARYLERVENTARLVGVYHKLLLDLPSGVDITWYNLIILNSAESAFAERYKIRDERNVLKFMLFDEQPGSTLSAAKMLRENVRTSRDVLASEVWECVNELYLYIRDNSQQGLLRRPRYEFIDGIIKSCQQLNGLLSDTTNHDDGWQFIQLGKNLERADMTTRILDAGVSLLLQPSDDIGINLHQVVWGHVLRSLSADLSYRRTVRTRIGGPEVISFLLDDEFFPRTLRYCHNRIVEAVYKLPRQEAVLARLEAMASFGFNATSDDDVDQRFRDYINELQIQFAGLHQCFYDNWFAVGEA